MTSDVTEILTPARRASAPGSVPGGSVPVGSVPVAASGLPAAEQVSVAPPSRRPRSGPRAGGLTSAVTEVLRPVRRPLGGGPRRPIVRRRPARLPEAPRPKAPRDGRWWVGAAVLTASLLLLSFVAHVALLSVLQHNRAQEILYDELRTDLANATAPTGQLVGEDEMTPIGTPVGLLQIPSIGLSEVVVEGTSASVLREAPGHRRDSVMPGQSGTAVLLGRQLTYGGPFGGLPRLQPGDPVHVTTGQGEFEYRVISLRRAGDPLPQPLQAGQGRLELQTADGLALFPSGVLYVDAELVSEPGQNPSRVMGYPALPVEERAMGQDTAAWFLAFFGFVFFAAAAVGMWWLWTRWGKWHTWLVGVPIMLALGTATFDATMNALPNLL